MEERKNKGLLIVVLNIIGYIAMIAVNYLANALPLNGRGTGEISDSYANLFAPAGFTFAIWGLIYLLLAGFAVYQILLFIRQSAGFSYIKEMGFLFFITSLANSLWIFAWHYDYIGISVLLMLVLLVSLIIIDRKLSGFREEMKVQAKVLVSLPFSVYLGWISVATIANITVFLIKIGWNGFNIAPWIWTSLVILVAAFLGIFYTFRYRNYPYTLVIIWALFGILIKRLNADTEMIRPLIAVIGVSLFILVFGLAVSVFKKRKIA